MKKTTFFAIFATVFLVIVMCCCLCCGPFYFLSFMDSVAGKSDTASAQYIYGETTSTNRILQIRINGVILNEGGSVSGFFGGESAAYGQQIKKELSDAAEDDSIKAVVLAIDSPGGTITGSIAITEGISYYRQTTNKPIIAHISGTGASGAYYAASATDYIAADPGSTIGSIGVIYGPFQYYDKVLSEGSILGGVITQNGIETTYITAGTSKDVGSPYRRLTDTERAVLQEGVNDEYTRFVNYVSEQREIPADTIRKQIGALPYGTDQSLKKGLIDGIANRESAYDKAAELAGIKEGEYEVVENQVELGFLETLLAAAKQQSKSVGTVQSTCKLCSQMLYLHGNPQNYGF